MNKIKFLLSLLVISAGTTGIAMGATSLKTPFAATQTVYAEVDTYDCKRPLCSGWKFDSSKNAFIPGDTEQVKLEWSTETQFSIKIGNKYLSASSGGTKLSLANNPVYWTANKLNNNVVYQLASNPGTRALFISTSDNYIRYYATSNIGKSGYSLFTIFSPDDYDEWIDWGCASVKGELADKALYRLAYGTNKEQS